MGKDEDEKDRPREVAFLPRNFTLTTAERLLLGNTVLPDASRENLLTKSSPGREPGEFADGFFLR